MVWDALLPADNSKIRNGPTLIRANQDAIAANIAVNHVALTDGSGGGKHKFLQMPEQVAAPTTSAGEGGLYTKDDGTRPALFYRQESNGTEIQLTGANPSLGTSGYTTLPGGLILQWGEAAVTSGGSGTTVSFPVPFTTPYQVTFSPAKGAGSVSSQDTYLVEGSFTTTGFKVYAVSHSWTVHYFAIGV